MFGSKKLLDKNVCPLLQGACIEQRCLFWVHLLGLNHNTGQEVDVWDCSFRWLPNLITEVRGATAGVAASVQDFRNHMINQNADLIQIEQRKLNGALPSRDG
jgi:hypothetical protein